MERELLVPVSYLFFHIESAWACCSTKDFHILLCSVSISHTPLWPILLSLRMRNRLLDLRGYPDRWGGGSRTWTTRFYSPRMNINIPGFYICSKERKNLGNSSMAVLPLRTVRLWLSYISWSDWEHETIHRQRIKTPRGLPLLFQPVCAYRQRRPPLPILLSYLVLSVTTATVEQMTHNSLTRWRQKQ